MLAIRDLALKATDGTVPLERIEKLPDDEIVIARLSAVRGIGRWTAEMFLIFQLGRQDVWPVDDLGVRRGYAVIHGLPEWPKPKELQALGEIYRPTAQPPPGTAGERPTSSTFKEGSSWLFPLPTGGEGRVGPKSLTRCWGGRMGPAALALVQDRLQHAIQLIHGLLDRESNHPKSFALEVPSPDFI